MADYWQQLALSKPQEEPKGTTRHMRKAFQTLHLPLQDPSFHQSLEKVYKKACKAISSYNPCWWVSCCTTVITVADIDSFNHPKDQVIKCKDFFNALNITTLDSFQSHMIRTLPKNSHGHLLVPQFNMDHPSSNPVIPRQGTNTNDTKTNDHEDFDSLKGQLNQQTQEISMLKKANAELTDRYQLMMTEFDVSNWSPSKSRAGWINMIKG